MTAPSVGPDDYDPSAPPTYLVGVRVIYVDPLTNNEHVAIITGYDSIKSYLAKSEDGKLYGSLDAALIKGPATEGPSSHAFQSLFESSTPATSTQAQAGASRETADGAVIGIWIGISTVVVILGWVFSRYKNREQEKRNRRLVRREALIKSFLHIDQILIETKGDVSERDQEYRSEWINLCSLMKLYGAEDEYDVLVRFSEKFLGPNKDLEGANQIFGALKTKLIASVRTELGFKG